MNSEHKIRAAGFEDAQSIFEIIKGCPQEVLARPIGDIVGNIDRFLVCEHEGVIRGTVSWQILPEIGAPTCPSVELKSLAVVSGVRGQGMGRELVNGAIARVRALHPVQIIVLTFSPEFFTRLGFHEVSKQDLMHKLYSGCINCTKYDNPFTCPETAMALELS